MRFWLAVFTLTFGGLGCTGAELVVGQRVEREISAGQDEVHTVTLAAGQYAGVEIEQLSISVSARVAGPVGKAGDPVFGFPPRTPIAVGIVAETAGVYEVRIRAAVPQGSGRYAIRLLEVIAAADRDKPALLTRYASPRLAQLFAAPESLEAFWKEVAERGTPLVEPYAADEQFYLVTFVYRGTASTRGVLVSWFPYLQNDYTGCLMQRWGETDLWYRTFLLRRGARMVYSLVENPGPSTLYLPARASQTLEKARWSTLERPGTDPFNKTPVDERHGVELPGAPAQPYQAERAGVAKGELHKHSFESQVLKNTREVTVYTPPGYGQTGKRYPVLVVMDGPTYLDAVPVPRLIENLVAEGKMRPVVAVFVPNVSSEGRYRELGCNADFTRAVADELLPMVAGLYRVARRGSEVGIAGSSRAGLMAVCAALHRPEVFGNVLAQSPLLWYDPSIDYFVDDMYRSKRDAAVAPNWAAGQVASRPRLPVRFHLDVGTMETNLGLPGNGPILESTRHFRDVLRAKGYFVDYQEYVGGHEYWNWRGTFADGLLALFPPQKR